MVDIAGSIRVRFRAYPNGSSIPISGQILCRRLLSCTQAAKDSVLRTLLGLAFGRAALTSNYKT